MDGGVDSSDCGPGKLIIRAHEFGAFEFCRGDFPFGGWEVTDFGQLDALVDSHVDDNVAAGG